MDEQEYLRVTNAISPFTGIEFIPENLLSNAADRGTKVHKHIEGLIEGFEDEFMDPAIKPYIDSYNKFISEFCEDIFKADKITQEKRFYCDEMLITGQVDLILEYQSHTLVIDWKTSANESISWKLQGAAYTYLLKKSGLKNLQPIHFVKLSKFGAKPKVYRYDSYDEDFETFKKCVEMYRYFKMDKTRKKWS